MAHVCKKKAFCQIGRLGGFGGFQKFPVNLPELVQIIEPLINAPVNDPRHDDRNQEECRQHDQNHGGLYPPGCQIVLRSHSGNDVEGMRVDLVKRVGSSDFVECGGTVVGAEILPHLKRA